MRAQQARFASIEGLPREPTFLLTDFAVGSPVLIAFGALWLLPAIGFIGSAIGVIARQLWWPTLALASAVISTGLVVLRWDDALVGMLSNLIVFATGGPPRARAPRRRRR